MNGRIVFFILILVLQSSIALGQNQSLSQSQDQKFFKTVNKYITFSTDTISATNAYLNTDHFVFLDSREYEEFKVSHIPNAIYVGFDEFPTIDLEEYSKESVIVVYCSIGYRSEKIGDRLRAMGFLHVYNLYGGIFQWVNQQYPLDYSTEIKKQSIHGYSKRWSKWIHNENVNIIW